MSNTQNRKTASSSSGGGKKRSTTSSANRSRGKKKKPTRQQVAARREIYAGICAGVAVLCFLSLLRVTGFLLLWLEKGIGGLIGTGFVLLPFCLLFAAGLFIVKRRGKVRLRVFCALLLPVLWGSAAHIFLCTREFPLTMDGLIDLCLTGAARTSGGLLSGGLALFLSAALSDAGAIVVIFLAGAACLLVSTNTSLSLLFERVRDLPPEEEEEEKMRPRSQKKAAVPPAPAPAPMPQQAAPARSSVLGGLFGGKRKNIDIPVGKPPEPDYPKGEPISLSPPNVQTPDQVISASRPKHRPEATVAQPVKSGELPSPVIPEMPQGEPVVPPAIQRAREFAVQKAAQMQQAAQAKQREESQTIHSMEEAAALEEPVPEPAEQLPWEEEPAEIFAQADEKTCEMPLTPLSCEPEAESPNETEEIFPPDAEEASQPSFGGDETLAAAAALAATQSPRESLGREGPEWDEKDPEQDDKRQQVLEEALEEYTPEDIYLYPPVSLLNKGSTVEMDHTQELAENSARLVDTLKSFGVEATLVDITRGPTVTRYELQLKRGTKFSRVTNLSDDIALSLGAASVRIAMIPDKLAVGIEVPNKNVELVPIRDIIDSPEFADSKSKISFSVGKDITGHNVVGDIKKMPHMLIAGTTGSGKSVCINSMLISLIYKATPQEVRLIMVDPKMIELGVYNGIPHLLIPVVTDPRKAAGALNWAVSEMMRRYKLFSEYNVRDLEAYNEAAQEKDGEKLPQIVIVIDELADLMFVAASEVENAIVRLAQMARAAGMHLVIATQRPSADVITGIMKANIPSRISFAVASQIESRIILDTAGAEKLLGRGDMLYNPLGALKPLRVQGCFITTGEIEAVVEFVKKTGTADYSQEVMEHIERQAEGADNGSTAGGGGDEVEDEMLPKAIEVVVETGQASVSMLQRRLKLGYSRAARLVDQMEERGIVGPFEGSKPRQVLITRDEWREMVLRQSD